MTADEFLAWAMERPEGERFELVAGEAVAMAPERAIHARTKLLVARRLAESVERHGLNCEVYGDGMAVEVDALTVFEPDAMVRCGPRLPDDAVKVTDPTVVVEVRSPSTGARDAGSKLAGYFRIPSLRHYLIVATEACAVIHHARGDDGAITTRILREGTLHLDPPGIELADLFA